MKKKSSKKSNVKKVMKLVDSSVQEAIHAEASGNTSDWNKAYAKLYYLQIALDVFEWCQTSAHVISMIACCVSENWLGAILAMTSIGCLMLDIRIRAKVNDKNESRKQKPNR